MKRGNQRKGHHRNQAGRVYPHDGIVHREDEEIATLEDGGVAALHVADIPEGVRLGSL